MVLEIRARAAAAELPFRVETAPGSPPRRILEVAGLAEALAAGSPLVRGEGRNSAPVSGA
jgi:hypothetical protein